MTHRISAWGPDKRTEVKFQGPATPDQLSNRGGMGRSIPWTETELDILIPYLDSKKVSSLEFQDLCGILSERTPHAIQTKLANMRRIQRHG